MTPAGTGGTSPAATAAMQRSKHPNPSAMSPTSISDLPRPIIVNDTSSTSSWRSAIASTSSNPALASAGFPLPSCATAGANRTNPASAPGSSIPSTIRIALAAHRTQLVKSPSSMSWSESHPAERAAPAVSPPVRCASYARVQASIEAGGSPRRMRDGREQLEVGCREPLGRVDARKALVGVRPAPFRGGRAACIECAGRGHIAPAPARAPSEPAPAPSSCGNGTAEQRAPQGRPRRLEG